MRKRSLSSVVSIAAVTALAATLACNAFAEDNITVPQGFSVKVAHEGLGAGRHVVVAPNGDVYVGGRNGLVALRDTNGDGTLDKSAPFGDVKGTEVRLYKHWLYASDDVGVYRYAFKKGDLAPSGKKETVVSQFPKERQHADKTFALDPNGKLYVNVGAPSNSCQEKDRQEGSLGMNPCPILEKYAGVWSFDGNKLNQTPADGHHFATGIRNAVAIEWNTSQNALFAVIHGRDSIDTLFPGIYNAQDNATRQGEEFHRITDGGNYGWPYTFWDTKLNQRVIAPEYGGDGKKMPEAGVTAGDEHGTMFQIGQPQLEQQLACNTYEECENDQN